MAHCIVLGLIFSSGVFLKGLNAVVQTQQTVIVKLGGEAFLNCQLMNSEDVLQVTWQKISPEMNIATDNKYFGQRVNTEFRDKVQFKDAGLQNSSIVIRNVKHQDEGCYRCLFNTYPDGAFTCKTCLQIYELHEAAPLESQVFTASPGFDNESSSNDSDDILTWIVVSSVVLVCAAVFIIFLLITKHMKSRSHSDVEKNKEVENPLKDTHETTTPLTRTLTKTPLTKTPFRQKNQSSDSLRLRSSTKKNQQRDDPKPKTSAAKRLW